MTLIELHAAIQAAYDSIADRNLALVDNISADTAFAIGEALGHLAKAKALVGRDIDDDTELAKRGLPDTPPDPAIPF